MFAAVLAAVDTLLGGKYRGFIVGLVLGATVSLAGYRACSSARTCSCDPCHCCKACPGAQ